MKTLLFLLAACCLMAAPTLAQADCGIADRLDFPLDRSVVTLVQGFGVSSVRHQGRYHTGEDFVFTHASTVGQPVRAIASGRVTFSSPGAWGRDGGVVIVEHTFSDGTSAYSVYGHIDDAGAPFPQRFGCVAIGQTLGTIAAGVRPAPHLHFEIRTANPDTPGAGYLPERPADAGYLAPTAFILNMQTWLRPSSVFRTAVVHGLHGTPLVLDDFSLLYLDQQYQLRRALPDGRILWRTRLEQPAAAVLAYRGESLLVRGDGSVQRIDIMSGSLGEPRRIQGFAPLAPPISAGGYRIFPSAGDTLTAVDDGLREVIWRLEGVPRPVAVAVANPGVSAVIGLLTGDHEMIQVAASGVIVSRQQLRRPAALASASGSDLLVHTWGGLYAVTLEGQWRPALAAGQAGESAALWRDDTGLLAFDGQTLRAFDNANGLLWSLDLPDVRGRVSLQRLDGRPALVSSGGQILTVTAGGVLCNRAQASSQRGDVWQSLGADGLWRLFTAGHLMGFSWQRFNQGC